ncbi:single-stranded DNA-binding protein [Kitasatospora sp. NBC_01287]|uniref:single-stranded DNA-binding protein n=1 Tax=Kitasatospora sp. NBC_01287 TaxID=2903573 RepID=UPI002255A8EF|nr:single-stranded DNA-binding protein [Kitasatospora sp. NBC_01287]MCX4751725.1 single-stranded DNA-binding protein [Kitasatospora sp. NBC_01287]MCX4751983.1 single-stranded DNA-binding protein [Kitasatospora sp. NBC_01287]
MSAPITLTGRLGQDPELRFSPSGTAIVKLSIVTSRRTKDDQGNWSDTDVTWWDCTGFRQLAENVASSLAKGMTVIAAGRVVQDNWQDKDGQKRSKLAIKLDAIGPDLNRATARVEKANSQQQGGGQQRQAPQQDPWNQGGQPQGQQGGWGGGGSQGGSGWGASQNNDQAPF